MRRRTSTVPVLAATAVVAVLAVTPSAATSSSSPGASPEPSSAPRSSSPSGSVTSSQEVGLAEPQTSSEGVQVTTYGTVQVRQDQRSARPPVTIAVHAVQRVQGATVVYLSTGYSQTPPSVNAFQLNEIGSETRFSGGGHLSSTRLLDPTSRVALATVPNGSSSDPLASPNSAFPKEPGVMGVAYAVLPELPATAETVHVQVGFGSIIPDVPVGEGLLEPALPADQVIPLGTGWPQIEESALSALVDPEKSVYDLTLVTEAIDGASVTTEKGDEVTIDLAADVLFAFDDADLTPAARAKIAEVVAQVNATAAPGTLTIVGHTDNKGTDAYNDDLSQRRAQSVAAELQPAIKDVDLSFVVEGRGEREPVATNDNDKGRQANRRVSITFTTAEADS